MIIDIGSGPWPKMDADIRMDIHSWPGVNCIHNLTYPPYPFEDGFFEKAYMGDVIEHLYIFDSDKVMKEVNRILKPGGVLEVTVPDARWIFERVVKNDWFEHSNAGWLNPTQSAWRNAMAYLFGGFQNKNEYLMQGMGHVNAFDEASLVELLTAAGFVDCQRVTDLRNPAPARDCILKVICKKE